MEIGILGSTGLVGQKIIELLKIHKIPIKKLYTCFETILNTKLDIFLLNDPTSSYLTILLLLHILLFNSYY